MGLKSKTLGLIAALGLAASVAVPTFAQVPAESGSDTATATVVLTENGQFAVSIADASLSAVDTAAGGGSAVSTGSLNITYTDTKSFRGGFFLSLGASDFASKNVRTRAYRNDPGGLPFKIPAANFVVVKNYNVVQGRFSFGSFQTVGYAIGDIGSTPTGLFSNMAESTTPFDVGTGGASAYHIWTSAESNALSTTPRVSRGLPGPGTAGAFDTNGSTHKLDVELTVPAGQPADTYESTLTITVIPGTL